MGIEGKGCVSEGFLSAIVPVVLVGGKSRRFGRDKLREPMADGGGVLVERPISALRAVFGPRVMLVGACDESVRGLADGVIDDVHPGRGPLGGIVSALASLDAARIGAIFVLPGDMPAFTAEDVRRVVALYERSLGQSPLAVLVVSDQLHPCVGVYTLAALPVLAERLAAGELQLTTALPRERVVVVECAVGHTANVNRVEDLGVKVDQA